METTHPADITLLDKRDFERDSHAAKYVIELDCRPKASERLFWLLNAPANEQRLVDAEMLGMPALSGVARFLEDDPAIAEVLETDPASLRFRQAIGVAIKLKMAKLGWQTTGTKGAVRGSRHFTKAERYTQERLDRDARRDRALAALEAVMHIGDQKEHQESFNYLMDALEETRRAEGRPFTRPC